MNQPQQRAMAILLALLPLLSPGMARAGNTAGQQAGEPCWAEASRRHGVPVELLKAVAEVESSNRARVIARNANGSTDIGFMQVNDWWLPKLAAFGIGKAELLDACTNLKVGAWILRQGIDRYGYNWQGIGAYGAGTSPKKDPVRMNYAHKVFRTLERQRRQSGHDPGTGAVGGLQPAPAGRQPDAIPAAPAGNHEQLVWSVFE